VKRAEDAEILRFCQDQNASDNQLLARAPLGIPGKYGFPLPYVIARKTRGPLVRAFVDAENAHSVERILATTADTLDVRLFRADGTAQYEKVRTRQEQRTTFADAIQKNPDSQFHIISVIVSGPL